MDREDAFYYKNLLMLGFSDGYDDWLEACLASEDSLSDVTLELSGCGSDENKIISVLHGYCSEHPFDEAAVCDKLRVFFREAYDAGKMSTGEVVSAMYDLVQNISDRGDYNAKIWGSMADFYDYYALVEDDILAREAFDSAFSAYLSDGVPLDPKTIWGNNERLPLLERIKRFFKK